MGTYFQIWKCVSQGPVLNLCRSLRFIQFSTARLQTIPIDSATLFHTDWNIFKLTSHENSSLGLPWMFSHIQWMSFSSQSNWIIQSSFFYGSSFCPALPPVQDTKVNPDLKNQSYVYNGWCDQKSKHPNLFYKPNWNFTLSFKPNQNDFLASFSSTFVTFTSPLFISIDVLSVTIIIMLLVNCCKQQVVALEWYLKKKRTMMEAFL